MSDEIRKNMPLFPIGTVMKLTELSARQIRYYEQHGLVSPARTEGNQRLYSFNDVQRLLQIKDLIDKGVNIAGIKEMIKPSSVPSEEETAKINDRIEQKRKELTDSDLRRILKQQLFMDKRPNQVPLNQGELSRFFPQNVQERGTAYRN